MGLSTEDAVRRVSLVEGSMGMPSKKVNSPEGSGPSVFYPEGLLHILLRSSHPRLLSEGNVPM